MTFPTALELNQLFRREVDDSLPAGDSTDDSDRLWKNEEVYGYLNEAQHALARRTRAFLFTFTVPVVADEAFVQLPSWVHDIQTAELVTAGYTLTQNNRNMANYLNDDYGISSSSDDFRATGTPRKYIADYVSKKLRLMPVPTTNDTLEISAIIVPRAAITQANDVAAFEDVQDIRLLMHYAKYLAYDKQDADVFDKTVSDRYKDKFDAGATEREQEINRLRRAPGTVRYNG